ncbi:MAG: rhomboid family intramembrane serine protease [Planctomycetota bacterium]
MFFFFPYRVDVPHEHRPVMNWVVLAAAVLVFRLQVLDNSITTRYWLDGWGIRGLLGSIWLHGGLLHLLGNCLYLWVFGNAVCSKLGNLGYLPAYVALGVAGGIGHLLFAGGPAVGASGAISGLIGMHLVLFPENAISCVFWWIFLPHRPAWFSFRSFWFILPWFALNIYGAMYGSGRIGYFAHIGGFAAGVGLALLLLKTGDVRVERYEKSILGLLGLGGKKAKSTKGKEDRERRKRQRDVQERMDALRETLPAEPEDKPTEFIHFKCSCGQPIKVPGKHAGRSGRCPGCSGRVKIPPT